MVVDVITTDLEIKIMPLKVLSLTSILLDVIGMDCVVKNNH